MKQTDTPNPAASDTIIEGELVEPQHNDNPTTPPTLTATAADAPRSASADSEPGTAADSPERTATTAAGGAKQRVNDRKRGDRPPIRRNRLALLALLLALVTLGALGYGALRVQQLHADLSATTAALAQSLEQARAAGAGAAQRATALEQQLGQTRQQLSSQQGSVNELQQRLTRAMQQINRIGSDSRRDWLLAEVEYLLRLANQRVLMEHTAVGALTLLQAADQILQETDDVSVYNVRKALATDIAALEAVPQLDVEGIFLRLAALNGRVEQLRLLPITDRHQLPEMLKEITPDSVSDSVQQGLAAGWSNAMERLGNLIVIRHRDEPVRPLLSPEQHFFLQQNLHLMLEQAQLALLQGKQAAFDASLDKALLWVGTYFQQADSNTQAILGGLNALKGTQVAPPLPDISGSLRTLRAYQAAQLDRKGAA